MLYNDPYGAQLDVYDVLALIEADHSTCVECEDPASCQAQSECLVHDEHLLTDLYPAWDPIP